jgi:hypothetical protein
MTDRLVHALPALRRLALSPGLSDHTSPSRPSSRFWVLPSTACTPEQRWTTPVGPYAWRATTTIPALPQLLASSGAPHPPPFPCEHVASGVQARSTVVQGSAAEHRPERALVSKAKWHLQRRLVVYPQACVALYHTMQPPLGRGYTLCARPAAWRGRVATSGRHRQDARGHMASAGNGWNGWNGRSNPPRSWR